MKNRVVVVVGRRGAGKTTLVTRLAKKFGLYRIVSHTTRPARQGEQELGNYHFVTPCVFSEMVREGKFAWHFAISLSQSTGCTLAELGKIALQPSVFDTTPFAAIETGKYVSSRGGQTLFIVLSVSPDVRRTRIQKRAHLLCEEVECLMREDPVTSESLSELIKFGGRIFYNNNESFDALVAEVVPTVKEFFESG